jgi:hypothetical protein
MPRYNLYAYHLHFGRLCRALGEEYGIKVRVLGTIYEKHAKNRNYMRNI